MPKKDLKYFMIPDEEKIVKKPAPARFVDENGERLELEIKVLPESKIQQIRDAYTRRVEAKDKKGNTLIANGEVVWKTTKDMQRINRHFIAEALVYPDLKDPKLMEYYHCNDITEMPYKVFPTSDEFEYVWRTVLRVLGIIDSPDDDEELKDAKN